MVGALVKGKLHTQSVIKPDLTVLGFLLVGDGSHRSLVFLNVSLVRHWAAFGSKL